MFEKLYEDFTANVLPMVQEGLVITKDYFLDLFARYVKYLLITDTIWLILSTCLFVVSVVGIRKLYKWLKNGGDDEGFFFGCMFLVIGIAVGISGMIDKGTDVVKDIYIPEVRVYEKIQDLRSD